MTMVASSQDILAALRLPTKLHYTPEEIAPLLGVSKRWLEDQCRSGAVTHVHIARKRRFTADQVVALLEQHTVRPPRDVMRDRQRDRIANVIARQRR